MSVTFRKIEVYPAVTDLVHFFISSEQFSAMRNPPLQYIMNFSKLEKEFSTYLYQNGLLGDFSGICKTCNRGEVILHVDGASIHHGRPVVLWRCNRANCRKKVSVRRGSFFEKSKLTVGDIFVIIACFAYDIQQEKIQYIYKFFSSHTKVNWYNLCRDTCTEILLRDSEKIGGPKHVVDVDTCKFSQRNHQHGLGMDGRWVFGGIDRTTYRTFCEKVPDPSPETLLPVLLNNIKPGTTVVIENWKVYRDIKDPSLKSRIDKLGLKFMCDGATPFVHSELSRGGSSKRRVRPKDGSKETGYDGYFSTYCVRKRYLERSVCKLTAFLDLIKRVYPLKSRPTPPSIEQPYFNARKYLSSPEPDSPTSEQSSPGCEPCSPSPEPCSPSPEPSSPKPEPSSPTPEPYSSTPERSPPTPEPSHPRRKKRKIILTKNGVLSNLKYVNTY